MKATKVVAVAVLVLVFAGLVLAGTSCGGGTSITGASVNSAGHLILTLSNGTQLDAGYVVGPKGDTGATGATGAQGLQGIQGQKGDKGDPGGLAWGTPVSHTATLSVPGSGWSKQTVSLNPGDRVEFIFSLGAADGYVYYWAHDPDYNIILTGNGGNSAGSGHGAFIAAESGQYDMYFQASGIFGATVTLNYTVYPVYAP